MVQRFLLSFSPTLSVENLVEIAAGRKLGFNRISFQLEDWRRFDCTAFSASSPRPLSHFYYTKSNQPTRNRDWFSVHEYKPMGAGLSLSLIRLTNNVIFQNLLEMICNLICEFKNET